MRRRLAAVPAFALVFAGVLGLGLSTTARAAGTHLTFQISDTEAYAYKASIAQPVVQAAPKCDPKKDEKFHCDSYDHDRNCPPDIAFGASTLPPDPQAPQTVGTNGVSGGAGDTEGADPTSSGVPQSSSIRLHRLYSNGQLGSSSGVLVSNGLASLQYTDLGGPPWTNGYSHTETDAFTNQSNFEERCYATDSNGNYDPKASSHAKKGDSFAHFLSHSFTTPGTDHYSECFQSQCQFYFGITASHALSQVHLTQSGDTVTGVLYAQLDNLQFPGGFPLEMRELQTYVQFESNGTADGLKWQAVTSAQGVSFAGQPLNLPTGKSFEFGVGDEAVSFGLAGPYATASKDGGDLHMVAPGFYMATSQQTAFFGGAELTANFGRAEGLIFHSNSPTPNFTTPPPTGFSQPPAPGPGPGVGFSAPPPPPCASGCAQPQPTSQPEPVAQSTLVARTDPPWAPVLILGFGFFGFLVVVLRWAQQFQWGRDLLELRPMRGLEWLYRAFVKT
jgi:hypothetical protein